ncbi:imidazole glycerol phosphate synthase subunit HisH [Paenibacillus silviterrae]|uniref:imidazole glycerol phosphate synthase subunit HisH n=1 Tax=Paenibacillus silviterrae TaxID=3242194 RepID=UPI002543AFD4|nr:imidazole glycerol phosphate synthase subunit HisH [Paenibacillus chinjuensis]
MITIVNYGLGNLGSVANMFKRIGVETVTTSDPAIIEQASKLVLPGVGHFDKAMENIEQLKLRGILNFKALEERRPLLGICLGMQLLTNGSEEGTSKGFGWIDAETTKFNFPGKTELKVPHMGWNTVQVAKPCALTDGFAGGFRFYFVHSYHVQVNNPEYSMLKTEYGTTYESGIHRDNIYGVQFHPEKSHKFGMKLLANFAAM